MKYLGDFAEDETVRTFFSTNDSSGGRVAFSAGLEAADFEVIKDGNTTGSTAGVTVTNDFDSKTGLHLVTIDLSADAFYATGSDYAVLLYPDTETVDSQNVAAVIAEFSIENRYNTVNLNLAQSLGSPSADTVGDGLKQATREEAPKKGAALNDVPFMMVSSSDNKSGVTGASVTATISQNGGSFAAVSGSTVTEIGNGIYHIDLSASDMNADSIVLRFTATGANDAFLALSTVE